MPYKYKFNEEFFDSSTPESAYVLGWVYSDGNLRKDFRHLKISSNDLEVLEKINRLMAGNLKILTEWRKGNKVPTYVLMINSKKVCQCLINIGLFPNKSRTVVMPQIKNSLMPYFLRGYFEGDGSVWHDNSLINGKVFRRIRASFTSGSYIILEQIRNHLFENANMTKTKILINHERGFSLQWSNRDTQRLFRYIYSDYPEMVLKRKDERFS